MRIGDSVGAEFGTADYTALHGDLGDLPTIQASGDGQNTTIEPGDFRDPDEIAKDLLDISGIGYTSAEGNERLTVVPDLLDGFESAGFGPFSVKDEAMLIKFNQIHGYDGVSIDSLADMIDAGLLAIGGRDYEASGPLEIEYFDIDINPASNGGAEVIAESGLYRFDLSDTARVGDSEDDLHPIGSIDFNSDSYVDVFEDLFDLNGEASSILEDEYSRFTDFVLSEYVGTFVPTPHTVGDGYNIPFNSGKTTAPEIMADLIDGFLTTPYEDGGTALTPLVYDEGNSPGPDTVGETYWGVNDAYPSISDEFADSLDPAPIPAQGAGIAVFEYMGLEAGVDSISLYELFSGDKAIPNDLTTQEKQDFKAAIAPDGSDVTLLAGNIGAMVEAGALTIYENAYGELVDIDIDIDSVEAYREVQEPSGGS